MFLHPDGKYRGDSAKARALLLVMLNQRQWLRVVHDNEVMIEKLRTLFS